MQTKVKKHSKASNLIFKLILIILMVAIVWGIIVYKSEANKVKTFNKENEFTQSDIWTEQYHERYFLTVNQTKTKLPSNSIAVEESKKFHTDLKLLFQAQGIKVNEEQSFQYKHIFRITSNREQFANFVTTLKSKGLDVGNCEISTLGDHWGIYNELVGNATANLTFGVNFKQEITNPIATSIKSFTSGISLFIAIIIGIIFAIFFILVEAV